jgi:GDP-L-fucose synthase
MLKNYSSSTPLNVGAGYDMSIAELASLIATLTEFTGTIQFDPSKPDGTPAKLMNSERLYNAGWQPPTDLITGLQKTIEWCKVNRATAIAA